MEQRAAGIRVRKSRIALLGALVLVLGFGTWLWWWCAYGADMESIERLVRRRFPHVRRIATEDLDAWLRSNDPKPILLDVRDPDEYAISHLPGARNVDPNTPVRKLAPILPKEAPIVTYCSVGYRSSALAERLRDAGYTNVQNLEGSIFRWANEDRPLVCDGKPTDKVHPYSNFWGRLVKPERRVQLPATQ